MCWTWLSAVSLADHELVGDLAVGLEPITRVRVLVADDRRTVHSSLRCHRWRLPTTWDASVNRSGLGGGSGAASTAGLPTMRVTYPGASIWRARAQSVQRAAELSGSPLRRRLRTSLIALRSSRPVTTGRPPARSQRSQLATFTRDDCAPQVPLRASDVQFCVEPGGIEPLTSSMPWRAGPSAAIRTGP